jgi:hypothetical protein
MRAPKHYVGKNHETIGTDILAILQVVSLPEQTLGAELARSLSAVKPDQWYPIQQLLEPMELLSKQIGSLALRQMGRRLFQLSHAERLKEVARSARDVIYGIDGMYHHANRGTEIGGWTVLKFTPGRATLEKTTPHHCVMEEGILSEALSCLGIPALVRQDQCFRKGADACLFVVSSQVTDERWNGS